MTRRKWKPVSESWQGPMVVRRQSGRQVAILTEFAVKDEGGVERVLAYRGHVLRAVSGRWTKPVEISVWSIVGALNEVGTIAQIRAFAKAGRP